MSVFASPGNRPIMKFRFPSVRPNTLILAVGAGIVPWLALGAIPGGSGHTDLTLISATALPDNGVWLDSLDLTNMSSQGNSAKAGKSADNRPITLGGTIYTHGVGAHADSHLAINLNGEAVKFVALVGIDDRTKGKGAVDFSIDIDGRRAFDSGVIHGGDKPQLVSLNLTGSQCMVMSALGPGGNVQDGLADWAGAAFLMDPQSDEKPETVAAKVIDTYQTFPPLPADDPRPEIHGPRVVGVQPGHPFLYRVPATGSDPLTFVASGLPAGLRIDAATGVITGTVSAAGTYPVQLSAHNGLGSDRRELEIDCGAGKLALTPTLGWNAWNVLGEDATSDKILAQADGLVSSGLADHGYNTIIIDDAWQGARDDQGNIFPNKRFNDIAALATELHARGLKLGLLSSPNPQTCGGFIGSEGHEDQDAATYASWGVDYLKYDWCGTGHVSDQTAERLQTGFSKMRASLDKVNRDIVLSLTTYGYGHPWDWAGKPPVAANSWTLTDNMLDKWEFVKEGGVNSAGGFSVSQFADSAGPGHWNDPGWLMVGKLGSDNPHFSRLTPDEQMTQITLWSMAAAPLTLACDLTQLNPNQFFPSTTSLLTNDEVIDVDQDALGKAGRRVYGEGGTEVWTRPLQDGSTAVAVFNMDWRRNVKITWDQLGLVGPLAVRDLWHHYDMGVQPGISVELRMHGCGLYKVSAAGAK